MANYDTFPQEFSEYQATRRAHWNDVASTKLNGWGGYYHQRLAEVYRLHVPEGSEVLEIGCGKGDLLASLKPSRGVGIDLAPNMIAAAKSRYPTLEFIEADGHDLNLGQQTFDVIIFSDVINDLWDVQKVLQEVSAYCRPQTRLIFNFYSRVWQPLLMMGRKLGVATPNLPQNWFTRHDLRNLLELAGFEAQHGWEEVVCPFSVPVIAPFANRFLSKLVPFKWLALTNFMLARPVMQPAKQNAKVSVVVAARNEEGHIDELMARIPEMGGGTEIIFVEGNSTDDTWGAIERSIKTNPQRDCKLLKQPGKGKGDAVRAGFDAATGDILMILDADITVPPEDLPRFFDVLDQGKGEFVNGVRLVYPMQNDAMRFANLIGNKFFSLAFSWLLGQPIRDTLCGTKVMWTKDYRRLANNRAYFGDFDPFGDFDLLFGAAKLNLKILEVPIRYRARRYGETNIQRWRHGVILLRMVIFAARRIKFV